jgi:hypothetical protein
VAVKAVISARKEKKQMSKRFVIAIFMIISSGFGQAQTFRKTKMVDGKGKEVPVELRFNGQSRLLTVKALTASIAEMPYASIDKLSYEQAARHRVKEGAIVMLASFGAGGIVMLTKSKNHWLYIDYKDAGSETKNLTLKLDKSEYKQVLTEAKEQTDKKVEILTPQNGHREKKGK